ncbi:acetyltransferase [Colletotrichum salicis]|uniref:Acetyltransferase n=1 Tax=Colletotrichum salicis TaxID=1209931 RepID=A0A135V4Q7_9PEZI|nr:acetyltransferase [Colletotrichum salicis]
MSAEYAKNAHGQVSILAVEPNEIDDLVAIHTAALKTDQFSNLMLLNREEGAHQNLMRKSILHWLSNSSSTKLFKAESDQKKPDESKASEASSDPKSNKERTRSEKDTPRDPARVLGGIMHRDMTSWESRHLEGEKYAILQALARDPPYQGQGIATKLIQQGVEDVDSQNLACWIHASPSSYRLYEKAGFQEIGKSEYDLGEWAPGRTGDKLCWEVYTFRNFVWNSVDLEGGDVYNCLLADQFEVVVSHQSQLYESNDEFISNPTASFLVHLTTSIILYFTSLTCLSLTAIEDWRLQARLGRKRGRGLEPFRFFPKEHAIFVTRATGLAAGAYVMALPLIMPTDDVIAQVCLRIPTFFYACKCWDLTIARARKPPVPRDGKDAVVYGLTSWRPVASYVWRLASETRYASFDIAVDESKRKGIPKSAAWSYGPLLVVPLTYLFPITELKVMCGLLAIQYGLEGIHFIFHPRCPNELFFQPWAAESFSSFWAIHWHHGAQPFLQHLGYVPARALFTRLFGQDVGKATGVLAAFSLSGIWHAWCGVVLTLDEYAWTQAVGLWGVFMVQESVTEPLLDPGNCLSNDTVVWPAARILYTLQTAMLQT